MRQGFFFLLMFFAGAAELQAEKTGSRFVRERLTENLQFREQRRYLDEMPKEGAVIAHAKHLLVSFGGWTDVEYIDFHDDDNNSDLKDVFDADLSIDTRLWAKGVWRPKLGSDYVHEHMIYAQFRNFYIARWPNDDLLVKNDNDGPHLDLLYLDLDLKHAVLRTGRQYFSVGRGIAYANIHDGIKLEANMGPALLAAFVSRTQPYEENIDYSVPGFDKESDHTFTGGQTTWNVWKDTELYSYFVIQKDESNPQPENGQDYDYDSQYWGIGASRTVREGASAWAEYIFETGRSVVFGTNDKEPVTAHAFDLGARYQFGFLTHPSVSAGYAFGSGDKDRANVTNTEGGNVNGRDGNFLPFGYYPAGYALAPTLSNIHVFRLGASILPLERFWRLRKLELRTDGYFYWKDRAKGGIYDLDATETSVDIGREVDFAIFWRMFSDITLSARYGLFVPGSAYPGEANSPEVYLSTAATFSF